MKQIWAPWRMDYVTNQKPQGCIFCIDEDISHDRDRLLLHRTEHSLVMLNRYPYTNGHLMVAPRRHTAVLTSLGDREALDIFRTVSLCTTVLQEVAAPQGFNIGLNLGKAGGAGVEEHLHVHIVPRWNGDTNFMTVVADVRVVPEGLHVAYDNLRVRFEKVSAA